MKEVQQLARFARDTTYAQISAQAVEQLKIRVLDTLGVAIGALDAAPPIAIRKLTESLGDSVLHHSHGDPTPVPPFAILKHRDQQVIEC